MEQHTFGLEAQPRFWHWTDGLRFPLTLKTYSGEVLEFNTYLEYHQFIKSKFYHE